MSSAVIRVLVSGRATGQPMKTLEQRCTVKPSIRGRKWSSIKAGGERGGNKLPPTHTFTCAQCKVLWWKTWHCLVIGEWWHLLVHHILISNTMQDVCGYSKLFTSKGKERWPRGSHISSSNEERVSKGAGEEWVRLMLLLNTERAVLLLVSVETNVCCSVLAGDKMELKKGKKRQLSLFFFTPPGKADETKWCKSSFFSSFLLFFFSFSWGQCCPWANGKWQHHRQLASGWIEQPVGGSVDSSGQ